MFALFIISVFKQQLQYPQNDDENPTYNIVCNSKLITCTIAVFIFFRWQLKEVELTCVQEEDSLHVTLL